jgi:Tat protein secretion system quality control protein TatD with DNase activity
LRKQKPNEPALMVYTAKLLAGLQGVDLDALTRATTRNAIKFFGLAESSRTA